MKSLTQIQDAAIAKLGEERSTPCLHKRWRKAVYRWHQRELLALGFSLDQICDSWKQILDMIVLRGLVARENMDGNSDGREY